MDSATKKRLEAIVLRLSGSRNIDVTFGKCKVVPNPEYKPPKTDKAKKEVIDNSG